MFKVVLLSVSALTKTNKDTEQVSEVILPDVMPLSKLWLCRERSFQIPHESRGKTGRQIFPPGKVYTIVPLAGDQDPHGTLQYTNIPTSSVSTVCSVSVDTVSDRCSLQSVLICSSYSQWWFFIIFCLSTLAWFQLLIYVDQLLFSVSYHCSLNSLS